MRPTRQVFLIPCTTAGRKKQKSVAERRWRTDNASTGGFRLRPWRWGVAMKGSFPLRYLLFALVALVPLGWRVAAWRANRAQPVDTSMAQAGRTLFVHEWKPNDPLANGGDGLGPVFNARSCVACHLQNGVGGSGGVDHNVTTFAIRPETGS